MSLFGLLPYYNVVCKTTLFGPCLCKPLVQQVAISDWIYQFGDTWRTLLCPDEASMQQNQRQKCQTKRRKATFHCCRAIGSTPGLRHPFVSGSRSSRTTCFGWIRRGPTRMRSAASTRTGCSTRFWGWKGSLVSLPRRKPRILQDWHMTPSSSPSNAIPTYG